MQKAVTEFKQIACRESIPAGLMDWIRQKFEEEVQGLWKAVTETVNDLATKGFYAVERVFRERVLATGGRMLEWVLEKVVGTGYTTAHISCGGCGKPARFLGYRPKTILTLMAPVTLKRAYYRCDECGWSIFPLDQELQVEGSLVSPALKEVAVRTGAEVPFERASELLKSLSGVSLEKKALRELTESMGEVLEEQSQQEIAVQWQKKGLRPREIAEPPERLYISPDGTTAPTEEGWKEAKLASVFTATIPLKKDEEPERLCTRYVAGIESSEAFGRRLFTEALKQDIEQAGEVVVLGDGAHWIWNEAETWLPESRIEIIDFYHAKEKLWDVAKAVYGENDPKAAAWAERWSDALYKRDAKHVLSAIKRLRPKGAAKAVVRQTLGYFQANQERMRYGYFRRHGYFIGSGVTESGCKHIVGARLKQAGMCWTVKNAQAVLQVRLALLNKRWDYLWQRGTN
jgi:hypothetical protein